MRSFVAGLEGEIRGRAPATTLAPEAVRLGVRGRYAAAARATRRHMRHRLRLERAEAHLACTSDGDCLVVFDPLVLVDCSAWIVVEWPFAVLVAVEPYGTVRPRDYVGRDTIHFPRHVPVGLVGTAVVREVKQVKDSGLRQLTHRVILLLY